MKTTLTAIATVMLMAGAAAADCHSMENTDVNSAGGEDTTQMVTNQAEATGADDSAVSGDEKVVDTDEYTTEKSAEMVGDETTTVTEFDEDDCVKAPDAESPLQDNG